MKKKCPICGKNRGKRVCMIRDDEVICSLCCASQRSAVCAGCEHYEAARDYEMQKMEDSQHAVNKDYTIEVNEDVQAAVEEAIALVEEGKFDQAESMLVPLEKEHPLSHLVPFGLAVLYLRREEDDEALKWLNRALEIYPYFEEALFNKAQLNLKRTRILEAVTTFRQLKAVAAKGDEMYELACENLEWMDEHFRKNNGVNTDTYLKGTRLFNRAYAYQQQGKYSKAIQLFEESLRVVPGIEACHGNMGICFMFLGRKQDAIESLEHALELEPSYEIARVNLVLAQRMTEGEAVSGEIRSVEYAREYGAEGKSYVEDFLNECS